MSSNDLSNIRHTTCSPCLNVSRGNWVEYALRRGYMENLLKKIDITKQSEFSTVVLRLCGVVSLKCTCKKHLTLSDGNLFSETHSIENCSRSQADLDMLKREPTKENFLYFIGKLT